MDGALFDAGRFDDARSEILEQRAASGRPAHRWYTLGRVELMRGDAQAALENFDLASDNEEGQLLRLVGRAMALYKLGRREEALAASAEFERRVPRDRTDMGQHRAELYAQTGRPERAVEVMARLLPLLKQGAQRGIAAASPLLRPLDELPQWHALLREYSIAPEDLRRIKFEISLPALDSTVEPTRTNDVT
jgi:tetratricopeptide (TPR) repeat protein